MSKIKHKFGEFESMKFDYRRKDFKKYIKYIEENKIDLIDILEHYTAYSGHMALHRIITLYEYYKMVNNVAGHIAEVGVYKGAGSLLFAKLIKIFENESLTQVHGFDWFKGTGPGSVNDSELVPEGGYQCSYEELINLIRFQKLDHILKIHCMDLINKEIHTFFDQHKHLQFKLVFMDSGMYKIMNNCIPVFWNRLTPGGIMIFDQYNHELAPGETLSLREILPNVKVKTIPNTWMPSAYIIKE